jgi:hypothetical protein
MTTSSSNIVVVRLSRIAVLVLVVVCGLAEAYHAPPYGRSLLGGRPTARGNIRGIDRATATPVVTRLRSAPSSDDGGNDDDVVKLVANKVDNVDATLDLDSLLVRASSEFDELSHCLSIAYGYLSKSDRDITPMDIISACDAIDDLVGASPSPSRSPSPSPSGPSSLLFVNRISLRRRVHEYGRYRLLVGMMKADYDAYVKTSEFLSPNRISRIDLPNVQDVEYRTKTMDVEELSTYSSLSSVAVDDGVVGGGSGGKERRDGGDDDDGTSLVPDCELENLAYDDNLLDKALLYVFRNLVSDYTQLGTKREISGIKGLLAQGREYMTMELPEGTTYADHANRQHDMVKTTLGKLMTPILPPFYRIFMSGIVPNIGTEYDGKQYGPWFYAPYLTSIVTPMFFGFLVGPSRPNRRKDGQRGGLVVEKCKFLQESGCKGLCLHQCKLPAQEFFVETLGMELYVRPNFETQECQWSFGEMPPPVEEDASFPKGCLVGCDSRMAMAGRKRGKADVLCM